MITDDSNQKTIQMRMSVSKKISALLVEELQLDITPQSIDPDAYLFGGGLNLDSIDAVEIMTAIQSEFHIANPEVINVFSSRTVNTLVDAVIRHGGVCE